MRVYQFIATGVGKSSLLNAVLDGKRKMTWGKCTHHISDIIVPTSSMHGKIMQDVIHEP
jgi:predicted GTPase